jgi:hypothetical protein
MRMSLQRRAGKIQMTNVKWETGRGINRNEKTMPIGEPTMPMQGERFDPHDPEYEKVSDLPKEQQGKYVDINGGFVTKEAADIEKTYAEAAAEENKKIPFYKKPFLEKNEKATAEDMILDELTSDLKDIEGKYYAVYLRQHLGLNLSDLEKKWNI